MPLSLKQFLEMIKDAGCTAEVDANGHYRIYKNGKFISSFAASHGKKTKGNEVWDTYIQTFKRNLRRAE